MADLATSGSLGYGIGLQAKIPDKTGLVLQLENQRLKRKALENQAQEEEAKKAEKQDYLFQKALNIDTNKWHRTLVPTVNKLATDIYKKYNDLYQQDPKTARNSIGMLVQEFNQGINRLETTNAQRQQFQKTLNDKTIRNIPLTGDEPDMFNYLNTGRDIDLVNPFTTPFGEFTVNPDSTIAVNAIGASNAKESAEKAAKDTRYYNTKKIKLTPGLLAAVPEYTYDKAKEYMADRYTADGSARIADMAVIRGNLEARYKAEGLNNVMSFAEFINPANKAAAPFVDDELAKWHQGLLSNKPAARKDMTYNAFDEIKKAAKDLTQVQTSTPGGGFITTTRFVTQGQINDAWNAFKQTDEGKASVEDIGENKAKAEFDAYVKPYQKSVKETFDYTGGGGGGFQVGDYMLAENKPVEKRIMNAFVKQNIDDLKEQYKKLGAVYEINGVYYDKSGNTLDDDYFFKKIEEQAKKQGTESSLSLNTEGTTNLSFGANMPKKFNTTQRWATGGTGNYAFVEGMFSHLIKKDATGEIIGVAVRPKIKEGEYGKTIVVPYNAENKGMFGAGLPKKAVQQKSGSMIQKGTKKNTGLTGGKVR
jgi:hypothetical protein